MKENYFKAEYRSEKWPPTMYVKLAVMRWVKLFIVGQPAGKKNGKRPRGPRYTTPLFSEWVNVKMHVY